MRVPYRVFLPFLTSIAAANAVVIVDDASIIDEFFGFDDQTLTLTKSQMGGGLFAISIATQAEGQFLFEVQGIAEEYALFQVPKLSLFTPSFVNSTFPFISNDGFAGSGVLELNFGETAYLAYWDDRGPFDSIPNTSDNFGWVEVTPRLSSGLEVVSGATAIGSGIIVGTTTPIPEPSICLLLLGSLLIVGRRTRYTD